jgi:hypothetical protein
LFIAAAVAVGLQNMKEVTVVFVHGAKGVDTRTQLCSLFWALDGNE